MENLAHHLLGNFSNFPRGDQSSATEFLGDNWLCLLMKGLILYISPFRCCRVLLLLLLLLLLLFLGSYSVIGGRSIQVVTVFALCLRDSHFVFI